MLGVVIPVIVLIALMLLKRLPVIHGNVTVCFLIAGLLALLLGKSYNPIHWVKAWFTSYNSVAYCSFIIIFGSIFATAQTENGAIETVMNLLRSIFGHTPKGLILAGLIALYFGGMMIGTTVAVATVIGLLLVPILDEMGLKPEVTCSVIVTGASLGSIMPPISNSVIFAASVMSIEAAPVIAKTYLPVGICLIVISLVYMYVYVGNRYQLPAHLLPKEKTSVIFRNNWKKLISLAVLMILIILASLPSLKFDAVGNFLALIIGRENYTVFSNIPIIGKITNSVVLDLLVSTAVAILIDREMRVKTGKILKTGFKASWVAVLMSAAMAFFIGGLNEGGQVDTVVGWAKVLSTGTLKIGTVALLLLAGMLLGSQANSMGLLLPILAPALMATGMTEINTCLGCSLLAMAGQGMPPADVNVFVIAGLVSGVIKKEVNPYKTMIYCLPYCIALALAGIIYLYV